MKLTNHIWLLKKRYAVSQTFVPMKKSKEMKNKTKLAISVTQNRFYVMLIYRKHRTKENILLNSCLIFPKQ